MKNSILTIVFTVAAMFSFVTVASATTSNTTVQSAVNFRVFTYEQVESMLGQGDEYTLPGSFRNVTEGEAQSYVMTHFSNTDSYLLIYENYAGCVGIIAKGSRGDVHTFEDLNELFNSSYWSLFAPDENVKVVLPMAQ